MDKSLLDQLLEGDWLKLLNVKRYQTEAMLARASVADHTYMVTMICMMITDGMKDDFKYPV